jgi:outer membrane protein assembly factor BamB
MTQIPGGPFVANFHIVPSFTPADLRMTRRFAWLPVVTVCLTVGTMCYATRAQAENWPQWRGPTGDGVSGEANLPLVWDQRDGVAWRAELPEWGTSTPAIWDDAIFVTTQQDDRLLLLKLRARDGQVEWMRLVGSGTPQREGAIREQKFHRLHNMASPSPVTGGQRVVAHFGSGDLAAFDFDGNELWRRNLEQEHGRYTIWWGHANSPVLFEGLVISACMQDSLEGAEGQTSERDNAAANGQAAPNADGTSALAPSYLVAHDIRTGRERWKTMRMTGADAEACDAYTTPVLRRAADGWELIVMGGNQLDAYDPANGRQLWRLPGLVGGRTVTGPTLAHEMIYTTIGMRGDLLAVRMNQPPDERGELPRKAIAWRHGQGTPDSCCPVAWRDLLFTLTDDGIVRCFDAFSGKLNWKGRVPGDYKASPLAADGRIYLLNTTGLCTVISANRRTFEKLAENQIDDETLASPAVSAGRIYLRGRKSLYCIGNR